MLLQVLRLFYVSRTVHEVISKRLMDLRYYILVRPEELHVTNHSKGTEAVLKDSVTVRHLHAGSKLGHFCYNFYIYAAG